MEWLYYILSFLAGSLVILGICLPFLIRKVKSNAQAKREAIELEKKKSILSEDIRKITEEKAEQDKLLSALQGKTEQLNSILPAMQKQVEETEEVYKTQLMNNLDAAYTQLGQNYQKDAEELRDEYLAMIAENVDYYKEETQKYNLNIAKLKEALDKLSILIQTANLKVAENDDEAIQYRLKLHVLPEDEIEIAKIRELIPIFRDTRPLRKMLWEGYYRQATNDLLDRIFLTKDALNNACGIYAIKNLVSGKVYIGQAVSIPDRLKTHIKAGLGIDATNNPMYKDMWNDCFENFTFEVVQICSPKELNEQEKFWISFYNSQDMGYNMTKGGAALSAKS